MWHVFQILRYKCLKIFLFSFSKGIVKYVQLYPEDMEIYDSKQTEL